MAVRWGRWSKHIAWDDKRRVWDKEQGYWRELFVNPKKSYAPPRLPVQTMHQQRRGSGLHKDRACDTLAKCIAFVQHRLRRFQFRYEKGPPHQRAALWVYPWVGKPVLVWVVKPDIRRLYVPKNPSPFQQRWAKKKHYRIQRLRTRPFPRTADCWIVVLPHGGCLLLPAKALPPWEQIHLTCDRGPLWKYWERWDLLLTLPDGVPPDLVYRRSAPRPRAFQTREVYEKMQAKRVALTELTTEAQ